MHVVREVDKVVPKLGSSTRGPLASLVSRYGLWAGAAASAGVLCELYPEVGPTQARMPVILAALFGLGVWLADINMRNRSGQGWIADTLLGVFISAFIFKLSFLLTIEVGGYFGQFNASLSEIARRP